MLAEAEARPGTARCEAVGRADALPEGAGTGSEASASRAAYGEVRSATAPTTSATVAARPATTRRIGSGSEVSMSRGGASVA